MATSDTNYRLLSPRRRLQGAGDAEALSNIVVDPIPDGAHCFVMSEQQLYYLDKQSGAPVAPPVVIAATSGSYPDARWIQSNPGPQGAQGPQGPQGATGATAVAYDFGLYEARPLAASAAYSDLHLWSWTDLAYPGVAGQTGSTDLTLEAYRDTGQIKSFFRHDQNNSFSIDYQMAHEWAGTEVRFHLHLIPMANGAGNVYFTGSFFFGSPVEVLPAAIGWSPIVVTEPVLAADQYKRRLVTLSLCPPPASPLSSSILSVRLVRSGTSGNDTYDTNKDHGTLAANLCLESYDIHYQRYLVGSEEEGSGVLHANPARLFFNPAWSVGNVYLQVVVKSDLGNACSFQLYDVTGAAAVAGSVVTVSSASYAMVEVGPLALGAGTRDYIIQGKYDGAADEPKLAWARFVVR